MRRVVVAAALTTLVFSACASQERPEGIVERWLLALNQGAAGEPDRYAPNAASEEVLPGWEHLDPGELDVVEVARAGRTQGDACDGVTRVVGFRVVRLDGSQFRSVACVRGARVTQLTNRVGSTDLIFPSEGGAPIRDERAGVWGIAIGVGVALVIVGEGLMRLVRVRKSD
ncbi:MAG: hypothetical protein K0R20_1150 [Actinomycetia bacterium]|nr:hypothetical protein [Actinomycetes bacterium]